MTEETLKLGQDVLEKRRRYNSVLIHLNDKKWKSPDTEDVIKFFDSRNLLFSLEKELAKVAMHAIRDHCEAQFDHYDKKFEDL